MKMKSVLVHSFRKSLRALAFMIGFTAVAMLMVGVNSVTAQEPDLIAASDDIADAPTLTGLPVAVTSVGVAGPGSFEAGEPECWPNDRFSQPSSLWFHWQAPTTETVTLEAPDNTDGLAVYTSLSQAWPAVTDLDLVGCDRGTDPLIILDATAGNDYWIQMNVPYLDPLVSAPLLINPLRNNGKIVVNIEALDGTLPESWTVTLTSVACDYASTRTVDATQVTAVTFTALPVVNAAGATICPYVTEVAPEDGWTEIAADPPFGPAKFTSLEDPISSITYTYAPAPANDQVENAETLVGLPVTATGTLIGATNDPGVEECIVNGTSRWTVWYKWTAPTSGPIAVNSAIGLFTDSVYTSSLDNPAPADLTPVACGFSDVSFAATAGQTYWLRVSSYATFLSDLPDQFTLTLEPAGRGAFADNTAPGIIEAEDFDYGAPGDVYNDSEPENTGLPRGGDYRDTEVDIYPTRTTGETGWVIGHTRQGEWLEYTVRSDVARSYEVLARVATPIEGVGSLQLSLDGNVVSTVPVASTGGWWAWDEVSLGDVPLTRRDSVIRITWIADDPTIEPQINFDRLTFNPPPPGSCSVQQVNLPRSQQAEFGRIVGDLVTAPYDNPAGLDGGDTVLTSGPDLASTYQLTTANPYAEYCINITELDEYEIGARVLAPDSDSDSFWVQVDDGDPVLWHIGAPGVRLNMTSTRVINSAERTPMRVTLEPGEHRLRFYHREAGVLLDTVSLVPNFVAEPVLPPPSCSNPLHIEAEWGTLSGNMAEQPDPTATFNRYVANNLDVPSAYTYDPDGTDWVEYCVRIPTAGDYRLSATLIAPSANENSLYVEVNGGGATPWHPRPTEDWAVRTRPGVYSLPAGDVTVRFTAREAGTLLDNFSLF